MDGSQTLFHAAVRSDWAARGPDRYRPSGYADEGFVHLSSAEQLVGTLHKHYPGRSDLLLLRIDTGALQSSLVWEDLYGSGVAFPHVYGPIDLVAVAAVVPLPCDQDGRFDWWRVDEAVAVRRAAPSDEAVRQLLTGLRSRGFNGCPEPRWRRDGLTAVSYIEGHTVSPSPLPQWLRSTEPVEALGQLLRSAHDASLDGHSDTDGAGRLAGGVMARQPGWVINHGRVGPDKVVWRDREPVALIDWGSAEAGPPEYDLVDAAIGICGHVEPARRSAVGLDGVDIAARLDALASGYGGITGDQLRSRAPDVVAQRLADHRQQPATGPMADAVMADGVMTLTEHLPFLRESAAADAG